MFDDDRLYMNGDAALTAIAKPSTWNHWRSEGQGPPFVKLGSRVAYRGSDVNEWLRSRTVQPTDRPESLKRHEEVQSMP